MPSKPIPSELDSQVRARLTDCLGQLQSHLNVNLECPELSYDQRGRVAGSAHYHKQLIKLNTTLLLANPQAFVNEVVPHELCHLVARKVYGRVRPHGKEWQSLMRALGVRPSTTHQFDVAAISKTFSYQCQCGPVDLTVRRHNKVQRGQTRYICKRCASELVLASP